MIQEHNGQGTVDEKIPPTSQVNRQLDCAVEPQPTDVKEQDRNVAIDGTGHICASEASSGSSPSTTTADLEKALSNVNAANKEALAPRNVLTNATPNPDSTEHAALHGHSPASEHSYPEGGIQAWLVVFGSFTGMTAGFGLMNTVGTFQAYLSTHQLADYSPSLVGWIFSIYIFLAFFCGVQIGPIFDAKGPRWLVLAGSVSLVGGTFAFAESSSMFSSKTLSRID